MTAFILPKGRTQFADSNGQPLAGGTVAFYVPGTTTPKDTYVDTVGTLNTNPVVLDAAGSALILGSGSYRQVVKDAAGNTIFDAVTDEAASQTNVTAQIAAAVAFRGALVGRTSGGASIFANGVATAAPWQTTLYDTDAIWSVANPTRLTVPAGVTRVRVTAAFQNSLNFTAISTIEVLRNGASVTGGGFTQGTTGSSVIGPMASAVLTVAAGDYFEMSITQTAGAASAFNPTLARSWFALEILG